MNSWTCGRVAAGPEATNDNPLRTALGAPPFGDGKVVKVGIRLVGWNDSWDESSNTAFIIIVYYIELGFKWFQDPL